LIAATITRTEPFIISRENSTMKHRRRILLPLVTILCFATMALGQIMVQDDFNYPAGSDLSANGWSKTSSSPALGPMLLTSSGLTYTGYIGSGVGNAVAARGFTERYSKSISVPSSGNLYAAFMIRVDTASAAGGYVVCFYSNNAARGRFWVKNDATGKLRFGLSGKSASAPVSYDTTSYSFKTTYLVVLKYMILTASTTDDKYALIVNPLPGKPEPAPNLGPNTDTGNDLGANTAGSSLSIQGRDSTGTTAVLVLDGLRVSQNWTDVLPPPPFYYKGSGALNDPANWGDKVDGTGVHPADFAGDNQLYVLLNTSNATLSTVWGIYGANSKLIVGGGTDLRIAAGGFLSGVVDVASGGSLTLTSGDWPTFGSIGGSVFFDNPVGIRLADNQILPASSGYYTLSSGDIDLSGFRLTVKGKIRCNSNKITGSGTFVLDSAATLGVCSADGITTSSLSGDVQSAVRSFSRYASYVYFGSANQVTGNAIPDTVANLTASLANRNLTLSLSKSLVVTGNLSFALGKYKLGSFNLNFSNPAGQSDSSYVVTDGTGALLRPVSNTSKKTMPVGSATEYRVAALTMEATPATATNISVRYVSGDPGSPGYPSGVTQHYKGGSWVIAGDGTPGATFRLDLGVTGITDLDTAKMRIIARSSSSAAWVFPGTVGSYSAGTISEAGITNFGQFALAGGAAPPPPPSGKRYLNEVFATYQVQSGIQFGQVSSKNLFFDLYAGTGDTAKNRPLVIFIHGGGFKGGDKVSNFGTLVCGGLAKRGYVVASIDYRVASTIPSDTAHFEAMLKALQDSKAAVRFFRKNASTYGVDATQIFATGSSAGSITALHLAYLDSAEVPRYVSWSNVGGSFEGASGNPGFSSRIQGVISNWGAIGDTAWMKPGDVPVYCVHGTADSTVFYDKIPADGPFLYGSKFVYAAAQQLRLTSGLRLFSNTGHTLDDNATKQDSAYKDFSAWLYTILKPSTTAVEEYSTSIPTTIALHQNYPNPFNPNTAISYQLTANSCVTLTVYDLLGRQVATLVNGVGKPGAYTVQWNGRNEKGETVSSGIYLYQLRAENFVTTKKMTLLK
jgi:dienelactone hydrolase